MSDLVSEGTESVSFLGADTPATGVAVQSRISTKVIVGVSVLVSLLIAAGIGSFLFFRTPSHVPADPHLLLLQAFEQILVADDMEYEFFMPFFTLQTATDKLFPVDGKDMGGITFIYTHTSFGDEEDFNLNIAFDNTNMDGPFEVDLRNVAKDIFFRVQSIPGEWYLDSFQSLLGVWVNFEGGELLGASQGLRPELAGSVGVAEYLTFEYEEDLAVLKEVYLQHYPLDIDLVSENSQQGIATVQLSFNENTRVFVQEASQKLYQRYIRQINEVITEKDRIGDREAVAELSEYRDGMFAEYGEQGHLVYTRAGETFDRQIAHLHSDILDIEALLTVYTNTGRLKSFDVILYDFDGNSLPPMTLTFKDPNLGRVIERPGSFITLEEMMERMQETFDAEPVEIDNGFNKGVGDVSDVKIETGVDTDGDGLEDGVESFLGTRVDFWDTDGDGVSDGDEYYVHYTDPLMTDTDGDGYDDGVEIANGYSPLVP